MNILTYFATKQEGLELVDLLLKEKFNFNQAALLLAEKSIKPYFDQLKDNIHLIADYPYVDKVFRDSYYNYYSTKLLSYHRDCIRISFFEGELDFEDFRSKEKNGNVKSKYLGFLVIRPTESHIIGRNVISPNALKNNGFSTCFTKIHSTVMGVKVDVEGFPHSSQDEETISCAETTIWSLMEYFGTKYPEYKPVLPSKIISTLNLVTTERQLPSNGLNIQQISFALREFGFGTRIYSKHDYGDDFDRLISIYIESGIPLIMAIDNRPEGKIGHAIICVGHEDLIDQSFDTLAPMVFPNARTRSYLDIRHIKFFDFHDLIKKFIFIDDNFPPFQHAFLSEPVEHYTDDEWNDCKIKYFIAPLYTKIYLEAYVASAYVDNFLISGPEPITENSTVLKRFFLASSRTYKDFVALYGSYQNDIRDVIIETPMPKFVWIAELSDKTLIRENKANGLVILDATEANTHNNKPLILAVYQDKLLKMDKEANNIERIVLPLQPFLIYKQNLRKPQSYDKNY